MKRSIKLVSHWVMFFGDIYWKYHHDDFQVIFHIVRLIHNFP